MELSDGSPRVVPASGAEGPATPSEREVFADVRHALENAVYRGWDMAPAHTVLRTIANVTFFLGLLRRSADGHGGGEALEDAATDRAGAELVRRARACGALP